MSMFAKPRVAREDLAPPVGRRMIVRCLAKGCDHAALIDQRRYFSQPRDWPPEGPSNRFRCLCGSRQARVTYTRHCHASDGPLSPVALALWF